MHWVSRPHSLLPHCTHFPTANTTQGVGSCIPPRVSDHQPLPPYRRAQIRWATQFVPCPGAAPCQSRDRPHNPHPMADHFQSITVLPDHTHMKTGVLGYVYPAM